MKVVNAVWDKRNLGVDTSEIVVEDNDNISTIRDTISNLDSEYIVIKTPVNNKEILWGLDKLGFTFIETQFNITLNIKRYKPNALMERFNKDLETRDVSKSEDLNRVLDHIVKENLFDSDRISLDNYFSLKDASIRYRNWVQDIANGGGAILETKYKGTPIGFSTAQVTDKAIGVHSLGAVYRDFQNKGFGMIIVNKGLEYFINHDCVGTTTDISSNNWEMINMHLVFGFEIKKLSYVYVKHTDGPR